VILEAEPDEPTMTLKASNGEISENESDEGLE